MKKRGIKNIFGYCLALSAFSLVFIPPVFAQSESKQVKIGLVTFLSGPAAVPMGIPARNAAQILIEHINRGDVPRPYQSRGLAGATIKPVFIDEGSKDKVADYKKLVRDTGVDMVVGYVSSGSCKSIAPVAEAEKTLTVFAICGTPQIFEDINTQPKHVFRTASHSTMDNVAAARYVLDTRRQTTSIAGINQDYSWGQDSWSDFSRSINILKKGVTVSDQLFPKIFAGRYAEEAQTLFDRRPNVVHSSFWGSDVEAMVIQLGQKGVFENSGLILTAGDTAMHRLGPQIPDGTVIGGRGSTGQLAEDSELNRWFKTIYFQRFGSFPTNPAYLMAQAILGVKKAADSVNSVEQGKLITALKGSEFITPSGNITMSLSNGHQAVSSTAYGTYQYNKKTGRGNLTNIRRYAAQCVNPPVGIKSSEWIDKGFPGAVCQ